MHRHEPLVFIGGAGAHCYCQRLVSFELAGGGAAGRMVFDGYAHFHGDDRVVWFHHDAHGTIEARLLDVKEVADTSRCSDDVVDGFGPVCFTRTALLDVAFEVLHVA